MTLWEFISWLWLQANKVFDWFSESYPTFRDRVGNFWTYLTNLSNSIYNTVSNWISTTASNLWGDFLQWLDGVRSDLLTLRDNALAWINQAKADITGWVNSIIDSVYYNVSQWFSQAQSDVLGWLSDTNTWFDTVINSVRSWVIELINPILPLGLRSDKIIAITDDTIFSKLLHLAQEGYKELVIFIDNPTGYILNKIQDKMLDFIGDVIGYGLGTQEDTLPDRKDWMI